MASDYDCAVCLKSIDAPGLCKACRRSMDRNDGYPTTLDAIRWAAGRARRLAVGPLKARIAELEEDDAEVGKLIARQDALLRGVVDAIRGPHPDPLTRWSVHDAPKLAAALVAERDTILLASAKWSAALRALVEDVDDNSADHELPDGRVEEWRVLPAWSTCHKCDEDPEESIGLCPYHKAKALLAGD